MRRGDIYFVSLDPSQGREQQGSRPVLIISSDAFNAYTRLPLVVPITNGGNFARRAGFTVSLEAAGTRTTGVIRCDQPRPVDLITRDAKRVEGVPDYIISQVLAKFLALFA